jgi:glycosyltransferase involved in cell wall biosynthesis
MAEQGHHDGRRGAATPERAAPRFSERGVWEGRPTVSVVVPMYNELGAIDECLAAFDAQTYPHALLEVLVVDGASTDGSREVVEAMARERAWLRVVDNPARRIPVGCNVGLHAATGDVVCFFSSHGVPSPTFVERVVAVLRDSDAVGVGGTYLHVGQDPTSRGIGLAMASPFGMASAHRFARRRQRVDTMSHPAYWKQPVLDVGGFDDRLSRNEDYELNWRLRKAGHHLLFDPSISSTYRPRSSQLALGRQFFWYGWWKAKVIGQHRGSVRLRHLAPPAATVAAAATPLLLTTRSGRRLVGIGALVYAGLVAAALVAARPSEHDASRRTLALAFPTMHLSWGVGFVASMMGSLWRRLRNDGVRAAPVSPVIDSHEP